MNPNYNAVGIGLVYEQNSTYKWYWAADFGGPGGTVKIVIPPAPPQAIAPAMPVAAPAAQPVAPRAAAAPRGGDPQPVEEIVDPEAAAAAARLAFLEAVGERRIVHLLEVLFRMGAI